MTNEKNNSNSPILLYEQIKVAIKEYVENNGLKSGHKIPNESELCDKFKVSRITIRRAIKELVEENYLEVIRGKGTFVKAPKRDLHLLNLKGFTEGLSTEENDFTKEIISKKVIYNKSSISKAFSYQQKEFLELVRLVKNDDGPFSVDYAYLPLDIYPGISQVITNDVSTFAVIRDKYKIKFARVEKEIEYIQPSQQICEYLGISNLIPVILVKKIIYDTNNLPVHYSNYYLLGDRIKFFIDVDYNE
ncbi:GntR family transcriptional regulator [Lederbergia sp. NSJ-179]|uniref:GntR family transcriptional regulator n=1 Tax=Lederbergia sp. NSJ-179 TaxID=2931402 RepID=UPI001FD0BBFC|nr:GntR family transcriptional regulator [Lederbergia sp. NSJ-179]MCJ7843558.1 GntR family transcriptional regulator [Lederbergia sp. NSJ-179]